MTPRSYESLAQAAARTEVSVKTLRRRISSGQLRAYRYGPRVIRVDPRDVDNLMRQVASARMSWSDRMSLAPKVYLTFDQAADRTGLSVVRLRELAATGRIRTYRMGRRILRLDSADLDEFLQRERGARTD